jgi:murein DD-endopeptidase MepM/ murein hydrolase activator NlpD
MPWISQKGNYLNIIIVSNNMAKARSLTLFQASLLLALLILPIAFTLALILPQDANQKNGVKALLPSSLHFSLHNPQKHLDALALQLGEIQARVLRLDAQNDRLAKMAGIKDKNTEKELADKQLPGRGGPQVDAQPITEEQLQGQIAELIAELDHRAELLSVFEAQLMQQKLQKNMLPSSSPVGVSYNSSSFGWRIDPFSGRRAFHEGLDFTAAVGTPIYAAAGGIVTTARLSPDYGKLIKISHGSGLETRYAHASQLLVKEGEVVKKGQLIGKVGSTGRSTGAHLHFEVRMNGSALDPRKYLRGRAS